MSVILQLSVSASAEATGWVEMEKVTDDIAFDIKGSWAGGDRVIYCETSFDPTKVTKQSDISGTYSANTSNRIGVRRLGAAFIRWRRGGTWSGTQIANIFVHGGTNAEGTATDLQIESLTYGADQT